MARSPKPTIAPVEGIATAGGLQRVATCDLAFASAAFCLPGCNNDAFGTTPAVAVARNLPRRRVMAMALSGEVHDAAWARASGWVSRVMPAAELSDFTRDCAGQLASRHGRNVADGKQTLYRQLDMPLEHTPPRR